MNPKADAFLQFCLLHFYGTKFAQDAYANRVFILNKEVYARQKKPTQQILQRVILEIKDDILHTQGLINPAQQTPQTQPQPNPHPTPTPNSKPKPKPKNPEHSSSDPAKSQRRHFWNIATGAQKKHAANASPEQPLPAVTGREFDGLNHVKTPLPTDASRRKVACMLKVTMDPAMGANAGEKCADLCLDIEQALWRKHLEGDGDEAEQKKKEYMKHARMLLKRLRDPKNGELRERLVSGELAASGLVAASLLDLLNPSARKQHDAAQRRIMIQRTKEVDDETAGAKSDDFGCPSCGNFKGNWFVPLQTNSSHVAKTETWGSKDNMDKNAFRVTCSACKHVFIQS